MIVRVQNMDVPEWRRRWSREKRSRGKPNTGTLRQNHGACLLSSRDRGTRKGGSDHLKRSRVVDQRKEQAARVEGRGRGRGRKGNQCAGFT
ncbi:hypothetical protein MPTK1_1g05440 [Marchantia polymorpha subsp. ruderalis]|uniref:Uncharacterized protein n=1 Tax=Marchantia polymorpha subsp. ruderalis TaxID=1480154 RepID=A0AAF6ALT7_MARPO|nr:hypothetical protein Mp_1g05440 [Marchantia polymorpha subsp. ruderalis]